MSNVIKVDFKSKEITDHASGEPTLEEVSKVLDGDIAPWDFEKEVEANRKNKEKLKDERKASNRRTLKQYRLK